MGNIGKEQLENGGIQIDAGGLFGGATTIRVGAELIRLAGSWHSQGKGSFGKGEISLSRRELIGISKTSNLKLGPIRLVLMLLSSLMTVVALMESQNSYDSDAAFMSLLFAGITVALFVTAFKASLLLLTSSGTNIVIPVGNASLSRADAFLAFMEADIAQSRIS